MVRKLIKYDFVSFLRLLLPVQLIVIGIAGVNRIVQIFEKGGGPAYSIVFVSSIVLLSVACVVALVMCFVIGIVRFYQGLYSKEGYLSHTLPVTAAQHLWSKLIVTMIFEVGTVFTIFLAVNVATIGDVGVELYKALGYLLGQAFTYMHGHLILFIVEGVVMLLVATACSFLRIYFCISIGQLVNRKKILLAFGIYFGLYMLGQIFATILIILGMVLANNEPWMHLAESIGNWVVAHPIASLHTGLIAGTIVTAVFGLVYFLVSRAIMTRRLNLS